MDPSVLANMDKEALKKQIENMKYQVSMERWPLSKSILASDSILEDGPWKVPRCPSNNPIYLILYSSVTRKISFVPCHHLLLASRMPINARYYSSV
ncbi:Guanine nucleotide-binding protein subunit gamma-e [Eufriesea mexicana]|nr:Guanine nucleotide-binding protein subunit gamma-e [Eufriesea mexicana]